MNWEKINKKEISDYTEYSFGRYLDQTKTYIKLEMETNDWRDYYAKFPGVGYEKINTYCEAEIAKLKLVLKKPFPDTCFVKRSSDGKKFKFYALETTDLQAINTLFTDKLPQFALNGIEPDPNEAIGYNLIKFLNSNEARDIILKKESKADEANKQLLRALEAKIVEHNKTYQNVDNEYQILNRKDVHGREYVLFPHQKEGADFLLSRQRALLDFGTGLSKTIISLLACNYLSKKVLIVCEKKLKPYWEEEARLQEVKATIIHYQQIHKIVNLRKDGAKTRIQFNVKNPFGIDLNDYSAFILDESHILANFTKDGTAVLALFKMFKGYKFSLTATPYRNSLNDYLFQMKLLDHPVGDLSKAAFDRLFDASSKKPKLELFNHLCNSIILTKTMEDIGINFNMNIVKVPIELDEYTRQKYETIKAEGRDIIIKGGSKSLVINTTMMKLQKLCSEYKVQWTVDYLRDRVDKKTLVLSNYNVDVLDVIAEKLNTEVFKADLKDKQAYIKDFSDGEASFFLAQRKIGQTGLNMQVTNTLVFHDLHWSLDSLFQGMGRIKRMNQTNKDLSTIIPVVENTIEDRLVEVLMRKEYQYSKITKNKAGMLSEFHSAELNKETNNEIAKLKYQEIMGTYST